MEFREMTQVEELEKPDGSEKLMVNSYGRLKQVSMGNAGFGNRTTVFYIGDMPTDSGSEASARDVSRIGTLFRNTALNERVYTQDFMDALKGGPVLLCVVESDELSYYFANYSFVLGTGTDTGISFDVDKLHDRTGFAELNIEG